MLLVKEFTCCCWYDYYEVGVCFFVFLVCFSVVDVAVDAATAAAVAVADALIAWFKFVEDRDIFFEIADIKDCIEFGLVAFVMQVELGCF